MILTNKTDWNSKDLRRLVNEALKRAGVGTNDYLVEVTYSRGLYRYRGFGYYNIRHIILRLPRLLTKYWGGFSDGKESFAYRETKIDSVLVAKILGHEIDHNRGLRHRDMIRLDDMNAEWAKDFPVRRVE